MSSSSIDYHGRFLNDREDFASDTAFKATDYCGLAHFLTGSTTHVCLGPQVVTQPDNDYAIERRIGLAVASAVEPMPVGLPDEAGIGFTHTAR